MESKIYSLISKNSITNVLKTLHGYTGLSIDLIDSSGELLQTYGISTRYCALLKKQVLNKKECFKLHKKAGERAQATGEAYVFSCHALLNHIAFPIITREELLGSVIIGPFLMDKPDSTIITGLSERFTIAPSLLLDLYDELSDITVIEPARVNHLTKLVEYLLSPLLPEGRALLLETQKKMYQQAKLNETIQVYKEQKLPSSLEFFHEKENELFAKVKTGNIMEVKALLNEMMGHVLFSNGANLESVRIHTIELTTLLSRVAMDSGAKTDIIYRLNTNYLQLMSSKRSIDELCILLQEAAESFMTAMFNEKDKGNPYIRKALKFIADNYSEPLTLAIVANHVKLSPNYLSSLFNKVVGTSFREHLLRVRIEESKRLLLSTDYSLTDIAIAMGFPDQSYYCKVFKQIVGITPGKYRQ